MTCIDSSLDKDVLLKTIRSYYKGSQDKRKNKIMKYKIIYIVAVLVILNIVCIPFLCNKLWSIEDISDHAYSFSDMIEGIVDDIHYGYSFHLDDDVPFLYYFGGLACAIFIFIGALRKSTGSCRLGSLVGSGLSLYIFYQINLGTTRYYVSGNNAFLTFGFYISCAGFIAVLIASLCRGNEYTD